MTSTGRSSGAARLARSTASRKEVDWPTSWVLRSIPEHWRILPRVGKTYALISPFRRWFLADFRAFADLARPLLNKSCHADGRRDGIAHQVQETGHAQLRSLRPRRHRPGRRSRSFHPFDHG